MSYGDYSFSPVPIITTEREFQKGADNSLNGTVFNISLNGNLVNVPTGGLASIITKQNILRSGIKDEGRLFLLTCDGTTLISGYPRINSPLQFNESTNNWIFNCPYNLSFQFDELENYTTDTTGSLPYYIQDAGETWSVEFLEDNFYSFVLPDATNDISPYQIRLSHSVNALGKAHYNNAGLGLLPWEQARKYVISKLGYNSNYVLSSGVINLGTGLLLAPFNHTRTNSYDIKGGSFSVEENWLVINTGVNGFNGNATESFTADISNSLESSNITNVSIQGTIQGLETRNYGTSPGDFSITQSKYAGASGYWANVQPKIYQRGKLLANGFADRQINPIALSKTVGHSPSQGTITYNYQYDDRPSNCISGALKETMSVNDTNANDVFAAITVLGRSAGPVLQAIGSSGATTRDVNIEVIMTPFTGCPSAASYVSGIIAASPKGQVAVIVNAFKQDLVNNNSQVFVNSDTESWDWKAGRYTRNVSWTYQNSCS